MQKFCRLYSILLVSALILGLSCPVFAVDIGISGTASGYDAYKIFSLSQGVKTGHSDDGTCPVPDCDKTANPNGHWNYAYTVDEKYRSAVETAVGLVGLHDIESDADMISGLAVLEDSQVRLFANALYTRIGQLELVPDYHTDSSAFLGVEPGYYLIAETPSGDRRDSVSLVMLDTAGQDMVRVRTKESVPVVSKKIVAQSGGLMDESVTYPSGVDSVITSVGSRVKYKLTAELLELGVLQGYTGYRLVFHDDVSAGLEIDPDSIEISAYISDERGSFVESNIRPDLIRVRNQEGSSGFSDDCDLEVVFDDIKQIGLIKQVLNGDMSGAERLFENSDGKNKIEVTYECVVSEDAVFGSGGNPNDVYLEFSNNPYLDSTGETPKDKVTVFVFGLHVDKTDERHQKLTGAEFELYKKSGQDDWALVAGLDKVEWQNGAEFELRGLTAGKYKLVETKAPEGYHTCEDIEFELALSSEAESDNPVLTIYDVLDADGDSLKNGEDAVFSIGPAGGPTAGLLVTEVQNYSGVQLPSTGGSGVYGIYLLSGMLLAVALTDLWNEKHPKKVWR